MPATSSTGVCSCDENASQHVIDSRVECRLVDLNCRDYVRENTKGLVMKRPIVLQESSTLLKEDYGLVPQYLLKFKLDRATSAATKQVNDAAGSCQFALLRCMLGHQQPLTFQHVHLFACAAQAAASPEPVATLPKEECAALLQQLVSARAAAHAKLQSLPFVIETPSQARPRNAARLAVGTGGPRP